MSNESILATVTEKVLEKPLIQLPQISLSLSDAILIGILFLGFYTFFILVKLFFAYQVKRERIKKAQSKTLTQLTGYIITISFVASVFSSVGYSLTYFLVGSTAILVGVGFGLQQLFVDLVAGVVLLVDKNINYGDVVRAVIPMTGVEMHGKIIHIGLRTTKLESVDGEILIIPNSRLLSTGIKSHMRDNGPSLFRLEIVVPKSVEVSLSKKIILKAVRSHEKIVKDKEAYVNLKGIHEKNYTLEAKYWSKELFLSENVAAQIREKVLELFNDSKISLFEDEKEKEVSKS